MEVLGLGIDSGAAGQGELCDGFEIRSGTKANAIAGPVGLYALVLRVKGADAQGVSVDRSDGLMVKAVSVDGVVELVLEAGARYLQISAAVDEVGSVGGEAKTAVAGRLDDETVEGDVGGVLSDEAHRPAIVEREVFEADVLGIFYEYGGGTSGACSVVAAPEEDFAADRWFGGSGTLDTDCVRGRHFVGPGNIVAGAEVVAGSGQDGSRVGVDSEEASDGPGPAFAFEVELAVPAPSTLAGFEFDLEASVFWVYGETGALAGAGGGPIDGEVADGDVFAIAYDKGDDGSVDSAGLAAASERAATNEEAGSLTIDREVAEAFEKEGRADGTAVVVGRADEGFPSFFGEEVPVVSAEFDGVGGPDLIGGLGSGGGAEVVGEGGTFGGDIENGLCH